MNSQARTSYSPHCGNTWSCVLAPLQQRGGCDAPHKKDSAPARSGRAHVILLGLNAVLWGTSMLNAAWVPKGWPLGWPRFTHVANSCPNLWINQGFFKNLNPPFYT